MNYAHLEILSINAPIGIDDYYDDGFVESILKYKLKLNKKYGTSKSNIDSKINETALGIYVCYYSFIKKYHHIACVKHPIEIVTIKVRAHEETHALDLLKGIDILEDKLLKEQRVKINFKEIDEDEVRASLGSLYALHARGIPQSKIEWLYGEGGDSDITAIKIYEQSKLPRKKFFLF